MSDIQKRLFNFILKNKIPVVIATGIVRKHNPEFILRKTLQFVWETQVAKVDIKKPGPYLWSMVEEDYAPREGFDQWFLQYKKQNNLPEELKSLI